MTASDASVILVGLAAGYIVASWLLSRQHNAQTKSGQSTQTRDEAYTRAEHKNPSETLAPWYEVLQVPATASPEEIKLAYRRRIAEYHPDRTSGLGDELRALAEEKCKAINAAYAEARHTS